METQTCKYRLATLQSKRRHLAKMNNRFIHEMARRHNFNSALPRETLSEFKKVTGLRHAKEQTP